MISASQPPVVARSSMRMSTERFEGFADAKASFFAKLARNQSKEWFTAHKAEYEEGWLAPMKALLGEARAKLDAAFPHVDLGEPRVMRIHRDVRFSKDKSPYKTWIGGAVPVLAGAKAKMPEMPVAVYVHVAADELFVGSGLYAMDPERLARFRKAVLDGRGKELDGILAKLRKKGYTFAAAETLKKVPKGLDPEHPRAEILKMKGLVTMFPGAARAELSKRTFLDRVVKPAKDAAPLVEWITFAVA